MLLVLLLKDLSFSVSLKKDTIHDGLVQISVQFSTMELCNQSKYEEGLFRSGADNETNDFTKMVKSGLAYHNKSYIESNS